MTIYIPQNIDPYNTHLKNLTSAYLRKGVVVRTGYDEFSSLDFNPDIIHFHMPEGLLKHLKYSEKFFFERLETFKLNGVKFLYTVHNILPHSLSNTIDYPRLFARLFNYIHLFIHHGEASIDILKSAFPFVDQKKHIVCHHGDYLSDMKEFSVTQQLARKRYNLPLDRKIILVFGQLQYKNISFAETVIRQVRKQQPEILLLMAGVSPVFKFNRLNRAFYVLNNQIFIRFRTNKTGIYGRFSQLDTYLLFTASDLLFLPHNSGLTSGLIPLAATLGKPFAYPNIGVFEEQASGCFAKQYEAGNCNSAIQAIDQLLISGLHNFDNSNWLKNNNWDQHVGKILSQLEHPIASHDG
jgi:hypothetical protein